jgi:hypothetical protein
MDPNSHPGLEADRIRLRIESQAQCVTIVIADRALGLPSRERPKRHELGNNGWCRFAPALPRHLDRRSDGKAAQPILACVERQPALAGLLDRQHRLAGADVLAGLGDDHGDDAVSWRAQDGLVQTPLEHCERGCGGVDLRIGNRALLPSRPGDRGVVVRLRLGNEAWWTLAREWPSFKNGLRDLISEAEFSEMRMHGPKIASDVAEIIAEVRRNTLAAAH